VPVRADKRDAILEAAFAVCARKGYAQACVQDIADEAGVAKPTVYNHLTDKATLFQHAVRHAARRQLEEQLAALAPLSDAGSGPAGPDPAAALTAVGDELLRRYDGDDARALRRLLHAELPAMPGLADVVRESGQHRLQQALADRLARLMLAGHLGGASGPGGPGGPGATGAAADPDRAAETFLALLFGPVDTRTQLGVRPLGAADRRDLAAHAAATLLHAATPQATPPNTGAVRA
jgi:TetR/AcrR family transcriptional repressor of mexJK operon